jgi:hypothetical protein
MNKLILQQAEQLQNKIGLSTASWDACTTPAKFLLEFHNLRSIEHNRLGATVALQNIVTSPLNWWHVLPDKISLLVASS